MVGWSAGGGGAAGYGQWLGGVDWLWLRRWWAVAGWCRGAAGGTVGLVALDSLAGLVDDGGAGGDFGSHDRGAGVGGARAAGSRAAGSAGGGAGCRGRGR